MDVRISDGELDVMEALWAAGQPLTAAEVAERIDADRGWTLVTVKTMLLNHPGYCLGYRLFRFSRRRNYPHPASDRGDRHPGPDHPGEETTLVLTRK